MQELDSGGESSEGSDGNPSGDNFTPEEISAQQRARESEEAGTRPF